MGLFAPRHVGSFQTTIEPESPVAPALGGGFLTTEPPGKSLRFILSEIRICSLNQTCAALFTELNSLTWLLQPCGSSLAKKGPAGGVGVGMEQHLRARQLLMPAPDDLIFQASSDSWFPGVRIQAFGAHVSLERWCCLFESLVLSGLPSLLAPSQH